MRISTSSVGGTREIFVARASDVLSAPNFAGSPYRVAAMVTRARRRALMSMGYAILSRTAPNYSARP